MYEFQGNHVIGEKVRLLDHVIAGLTDGGGGGSGLAGGDGGGGGVALLE